MPVMSARLALAVGASALALSAAWAEPRHRPQRAATPSLAGDAKPRPVAPAPKAYGGTPVDVLTYHYDQGRSGWNATETDLTPATVASSKFTQLAVLNVDGNVFAQPLVVTNYTMPDSTVHDLLLIVTGHNSVYAYDAKTYALLWQKSMGTPQQSNDVGCGDVVPEYGISSTPVVARNADGTAAIYLVAATEPTQNVFQTMLHALDVGTGNDLVTPREIKPQAKLSDGSVMRFDAQNQWSRAGLALANGSVYVSIGSHCDNNAYGITGWELRYSTGSLAPQNSFHTINTAGGYELASIWMTGFAPAVDPSGNVFVVTGNGNFTKGQRDWGESVLKLSPQLTVQGKFTPSGYDSLNNGDTDFGSGGVMLLPPVSGQTAPPLAVAMGKASTLYLMNQNNLGNEKPNDAGALQSQYAGGGGLWGGPAFFSGANGPFVFTQTDGDVLRGFSVATTGKPALTAALAGTTGAGYGGTTPVVSSNGGSSGVVWAVRRSNPVSFEAYDASRLGAPLFTQNIGSWSNQNNQNPFVAPVEANGRVYAPNYLTVTVFGLTQ